MATCTQNVKARLVHATIDVPLKTQQYVRVNLIDTPGLNEADIATEVDHMTQILKVFFTSLSPLHPHLFSTKSPLRHPLPLIPLFRQCKLYKASLWWCCAYILTQSLMSRLWTPYTTTKISSIPSFPKETCGWFSLTRVLTTILVIMKKEVKLPGKKWSKESVTNCKKSWG